MIKKIAGITSIILGGIALLGSSESTKKILPGSLPASIPPNTLFYAGCALLIIGAFLMFGSNKKRNSQEPKEVPIYEGDRIVGYRRI
jgi:hypothetical protein